MIAPWSPMMAPPLPLRNDAERDTCEHAYPAEDCLGGVEHVWHAPSGAMVYYSAVTPEEFDPR